MRIALGGFMKKRFLIFLLVALMLFSVIALSSCKEEVNIPDAPKGYIMFYNSEIYFAYPENWISQTINEVTRLMPSVGGNNITVSKGEYHSNLDNLTVDSFNKYLLPSLTASGLEVSNLTITHDLTKGFDIATISYDTSTNGINMKQTIYMFKAHDGMYNVMITEVTDDLSLVRTVFNTLGIN